MKLGWLLVAGAAACSSSHPTTIVDVRMGEDCAVCHLKDWKTDTNASHAAAQSTRCQDCHVMTAWVPALAGLHPEAAFPIASGPHAVACQSCHDAALGSSAGGQNTTCVGCHPRAEVDPLHTGVGGYAFDAAAPHFCLSCHPDGKASAHPEARFPITTGPHRVVACADCHDSSLGANAGGMNANCTGCHTGEHAKAPMVSRHGEVRNFVWSDTDKKFCLSCHPTGLGGN